MFIGRPPGNYDRLLDFSEALTGNLFFVPTTTFLDAVGENGATQAAAPESAKSGGSPGDGSLNIGSLKGEVP